MASVAAQAEAKRRILNPSYYDFSENNSIDPPALSPGTQSPNTTQTPNTNPSSRRGSADPSLTAILVTQSGPNGNSTEKSSKKKKDRKDKRTSADSQTAGCVPGLRNMSPGKKTKSPSASETRVLAPDENVGAMGQFDDSAVAANGTPVPPPPPGNGAPAPAAAAKSKSIAPERPKTADEDKERRGKFSKFWKKKWRAVSGMGDGEATENGEKGKEKEKVRRGPPMDDLRLVEASLPTPRR